MWGGCRQTGHQIKTSRVELDLGVTVIQPPPRSFLWHNVTWSCSSLASSPVRSSPHMGLWDCKPRAGLREASGRSEFPPPTPPRHLRAPLRHGHGSASQASDTAPHRAGALLLPFTVGPCPLPGGRGVSVGPILSSSASDIFCDNENGPNFLFHNQGDGTFVDAAASAGECSHYPVSLSSLGPQGALGCPTPSSITPRALGRTGQVTVCTIQGNILSSPDLHIHTHTPWGLGHRRCELLGRGRWNP